MTLYVLVILIATGTPNFYVSEVVDVFEDKDMCMAIAAELDEISTCIEVT